MNVLVRAAAWVAVLAAAVAYIATHAVYLPADAGVVDAYDLSAPVAFALAPDEEAIKIVSWLVTAEDGPADPRASRPYAITAEQLDGDGAVVQTERVWSVTRVERWEDATKKLLRVAWLPGAPDRVHASRVLRLHPREGARGGTLRLTGEAPVPGGRVLAIVYSQGERSLAGQVRLRHGDAADFRADVADAIDADGWDALPDAWQANAAQLRWDRLGALATGGLVPTTRLAAASVDGTEAVGVLVPGGGVATWTLVGPVRFGGAWAAPDGTPRITRGRVRIEHADGAVEEHALDGPTFGPWDIPEAASVHVASVDTMDVRWVRAWIEGKGSVWGAPASHRDETGRTWIAPDLRAEQVFRARPDAPLAYEANGGEVLRVSLRPRMRPGRLFGLRPAEPETGATVELSASDPSGDPLGTWTVAAPAVPSAYERYIQGDDYQTARVSEETVSFLRVPDGAARLVVTPTAAVDVTVEVESGAAPVPHPAYPAPPIDGRIARFAPFLHEAWRARAPLELEALALAGRLVRFDGQVRLVSRGTEPEEELTARSIALPGSFDLVAEPARAAWNRARVEQDGSMVVIPPSGRLRVDYRVDAGQVGRAAPLVVAGQSREAPILATAGELRLAGLPPGPANVRVGVPGLFLARAAGSSPWQTWRVRRMDTRETLALPLAAGPQEVVITPYVRGLGEVRFSWRVGGAVRPGLFTRATTREGQAVVVPSESEARPMSFGGAALRRGRDVRIRLGDDLAAGGVTLALTLESAGPAWIRARTTHGASPGAEPRD